MTIISLKSEKFNMSSELLEVSTPNGEMIIDVKSMLKEPLHSDSAYFNATEIAKMFNVRLDQITRTKEWKIIGKDKITVRGRHNSGTWLPLYLLQDFFRTILPANDYLNLIKSGQLDIVKHEVDTYKHVYIILAHDDTIKIGITSNIDRRFKEIKNASGKDIVDFIFTDKLYNAYNIEQFLLAYFDDYRINGEWLQGVSFDVVVTKLNDVISKYYLNDIALEGNKIKLIEIK